MWLDVVWSGGYFWVCWCDLCYGDVWLGRSDDDGGVYCYYELWKICVNWWIGGDLWVFDDLL